MFNTRIHFLVMLEFSFMRKITRTYIQHGSRNSRGDCAGIGNCSGKNFDQTLSVFFCSSLSHMSLFIITQINALAGFLIYNKPFHSLRIVCAQVKVCFKTLWCPTGNTGV